MSKQCYACYGGKYYTTHDNVPTYIPENVDYKSNAIQTKLYDSDMCVIDAYMYHTDLVTECNPKRVAFMKEFLINEKVKEILDLNNDYAISVDYTLYNKNGEVLSSGKSSVRAIPHDAVINSDIQEENILEYHKGLILDSALEIRVPTVSAYGIKNAFVQHPFTLKINKISVSSTVGENKYVIESDEQTTDHKHYHASCCQYNIHHCNHMLFNDYSSHFMTNAHVGSTIIDQMVVPAELQIPPEYTEILMCEIACEGNQYVMKFDRQVSSIRVNIEMLLDNSCVVYNKDDIDAIIEANSQPEENP